MKKLILTSLALVIAGSSAIAMAESASASPYRHQGIHQRAFNQQNRIYSGVRTGALTLNETRRLQRTQARILNRKSRFLADGRLSRRERLILQNNLNRSSRSIYRLKHNHRHH